MEFAPPDPLVWVNGAQGGLLSPLDRGLAYGDGLFETMRFGERGIPLLGFHERRLLAGCERLRIAVDAQALRAEIGSALAESQARLGSGVLKLVVTRGSGGRGYRTDPGATPTRVLSALPLPAWPAGWREQGVAVRFCDTRLGANPQLAGLKHLNRLEQVLARLEWDDDDIAEGLLSDARGRVVEGVSTNLFLVSGGRILTPPIETCGVAGVMRQYLLEDGARALGLAVSPAPCERGLLSGAQEIFLCNAVAGIWPVRNLAGRVMTPGPVTRRIQAHVRELFGG